MYVIDQDIANQISKTQKFRNPKMARLFSATEEEAELIEIEEREKIGELSGDQVARGWIMYAPLLFEHAAITNFIREKGSYYLRAMMPEILTSSEAALIAQKDIMLTEEETMALKELFDKRL